jgi:hypothetical protein
LGSGGKRVIVVIVVFILENKPMEEKRFNFPVFIYQGFTLCRFAVDVKP